MTIRSAQLEDVSAIRAVEERAAFAPWSESSIRSCIESPTQRGLCIGAPSHAHLLISEVLDEAEVLTIAVDPSHRRRGFARNLLQHAQADWARRGFVRAFLEVRADNHGAIALYEGLGWESMGRRPRYYRDGMDALLYQWRPSCGG